MITIGDFTIAAPQGCRWKMEEAGRSIRFSEISGDRWSVTADIMKPPMGLRIDVDASISQAVKDLRSLRATVTSISKSRTKPVIVDIHATNSKGIPDATVWIHDVHADASTLSSIAVYRGNTPPVQIGEIFDSIRVSQ